MCVDLDDTKDFALTKIVEYIQAGGTMVSKVQR
jgi:hypothetical protein